MEQTENLNTSPIFKLSNEEFMRALLKESGVLEPDGIVFCSNCKKPIGRCFGWDMYVNWAYCPCKSEELRKIRASSHLADGEYL